MSVQAKICSSASHAQPVISTHRAAVTRAVKVQGGALQAIESTLVVIDQQHTCELVVEKAKQIADISQSHIHLLLCARSGHTAELQGIEQRLQQQGYGVTVERAWHGSTCKTILNVQETEGCALIIKQHHRDSELRKSFLLPEDWQLLRQSQTPVLLAKSNKPWAGGRILAAIDAGSGDPVHRLLQVGVLNHGQAIAQRVKGSLHMMSAHPYPMLSAPDPRFQLKEDIARYYRQSCRHHQKTYQIPDEHLHIEEGPAEVMIPAVAHRLGAVLTIIGSVGRSGISGALVGNTAESILDSLESDALVIKPCDVIYEPEALTRLH